MTMFLLPDLSSVLLEDEATPARAMLRHFAFSYGIKGRLLDAKNRQTTPVVCLDFGSTDYYPQSAGAIPEEERPWYRTAVFYDMGASLAVQYGAKFHFFLREPPAAAEGWPVLDAV